VYGHVHEKIPSGGKNEDSFEAEALCIRAGHEHRGYNGEHHLEIAVSALRDAQVFVPAQCLRCRKYSWGGGHTRVAEADVIEHDVVETTDEGAGKPTRCVGAKRQAAACM